MSEYIEIGSRKVGFDYAPLVVAEIGINHNGSLKIAKEMVDAAARAGVEVVKHQTHIVEDEMSDEAKSVIPGNSKRSIYDIMESCALSYEHELELKLYVEQKGMIFISTPFSRKAADRLAEMGVMAFKIGSGECNNHPLVKHIASFGKPIIMSTGMNSISDVRKTVKIIKDAGVGLALMHTTNLYPTPENLVRLGAMQDLINEFPEIPVGLSDHTTSNLACLSAVALGACILERHFTDSMDREGPDIICSMDEQSTRELIRDSIRVFSMLGGKKEPAKEESVTSNFAFASVVTINEVALGDKLTMDNIWVKRPGTGEILAEHFETLLGKMANKDLKKGAQLKWSDFD